MTMSQNVKLPSMGEGVHEATVVKWLKQIGEPVKAGEPILEISTDKVDTELSSPGDGFLIGCFVTGGDLVKVGQVLGQIAADKSTKSTAPEAGQSFPSNKTQGKETQTHPKEHSSHTREHVGSAPMAHLPSMPQTYAGFVRSSPLVRKLAKDLGIPLYEVTPTGKGGRITKEDCYSYLERGGSASKIQIPLSNQAAEFTPTLYHLPQPKLEEDGSETLDGVKVRRTKMSKIRRITAEHMMMSVRISPHVTTTFEMDLHHIADQKKSLAPTFEKKGVKLTYTAFFIKAAAMALVKHPEVNTSLDGEDILYKESCNIGCAVAIESGLIVPVLKDVQNLSLFEVAEKLQDIVQRSRSKQLAPQELSGGTFSITNPGMYGSLHSQPIINQPQVAILSIGAIVEKPIFINKEMLIHPLCQIGLTFDHRVIDGEGGAQYLATLREILLGDQG